MFCHFQTGVLILLCDRFYFSVFFYPSWDEVFVDNHCIHKNSVKLLSRVWLFAILWTVGHQAPLSMGFPRQECWSGLPFPSPGDIPDPGIKPGSASLQADALTSEPPMSKKKKRMEVSTIGRCAWTSSKDSKTSRPGYLQGLKPWCH